MFPFRFRVRNRTRRQRGMNDVGVIGWSVTFYLIGAVSVGILGCLVNANREAELMGERAKNHDLMTEVRALQRRAELVDTGITNEIALATSDGQRDSAPYVAGLRKAQKIVCGGLRSAPGNVGARDARKWPCH